jgi:Putative Ig domain
MTSDALRPARQLYQKHIFEFIALAILLLSLPCLTACTAAHSAGVSNASTANPQLSGNLAPASVGSPYNGTISVSGGKGPYVFSLATGSLPAGLTLSQATGTISGTPAKTGMASFTVQVKDSTGVQALQPFQISVVTSATVALQVAPAVTTVTSSGTMQFVSVVTNTSNTTVTWSASMGTISASGVYQAPAVTAKTTATVTATSNADSTKSAKASLTLVPAGSIPLVVASTSLQQATAGASYSTMLSGSGGTTPYTWTLTSGSLPSGISMQNSGLLSGTTSQTGTFTFTVQVADSSSPKQTALRLLQITVAAAPIVGVTVTPAITTVTSSGTMQFTALVTNTSNVGVTWSASRGSISSSGLYQAPSVTANVGDTITATSSADTTRSGRGSITITPVLAPPLSVITASLAGATSGTAYSATLQGTGGTTPYSWSLSSGTLPSGLSLQSSGLLSGTPTQTGQFSITVQAVDSSSPNKTATKALTLAVGSTIVAGNIAPSTLFGFTATNTGSRDYPTVNYGMQRFWDSPPLQWPSINTASGVFDYSNLDSTLAQAYSSGVTEGMYTLARTPAWATSNPADSSCHYTAATSGGGAGQCDAPIDLKSDGTGTNAIWKAWITNIATHANNPTYLQTHAHIRYWEIWNEPDAQFYWSGSIAQLARLTEDANCIITGRGVIHESGNGTATPCTATAIDPTAKIVMASGHADGQVVLNYAQNQLYCTASPTGYQLPCPNPANAIASAIDIVNFHMKPGNSTGNTCPAPTPCTPETAMQTYVNNLHGILQPAELAKPLWNGEASFAEPGFTGAYTDADMASSFMSRFYLLNWSLGVNGIAWYSWSDLSNQPASVQTAYQQTYNWLSGSSLTTPCAASGNIWSCTITKSGTQYLIMWDASQSCANGSCSTTTQTVAAQWAQYQDMTASTAAVAISGRSVPVGIKPVVLQ